MTQALPSRAARLPDQPNLRLFDVPAPPAETDARPPGLQPQTVGWGVGPEILLRVAPSGSGNGVGIQQHGSGQSLSASDTGEVNRLDATQQGDGQRVVASQSGTLNVMTLRQTGSDHAITAVQGGTMNGIDALQTGVGNRLTIIQR